MDILVVSLIFLFNSLMLIYFVDTTKFSPCTNTSLENNIPVVSFCKESTADNGFIVMDGYYAHSNTDETTYTCVATGQNGQKIAFSNANFVADAIEPPCASEIKVSNLNTEFIMSCTSRGSITFGQNREISVVLTKQQTTADTRYCIFVQLDLGSTFSITCEGNSADVTETPTSVQTTATQTSFTTTYVDVSSTTDPDDPLQTTTVSVDKASQTSIANDKSTNGLIVTTAVGWCFCIVFGVTTIILLYQRRYYKQIIKEQTNRSVTYDDLRARDVRNYSTIGDSNTGGQEYEIVTANNV